VASGPCTCAEPHGLKLAAILGADWHERTEERLGHRNGYRARPAAACSDRQHKGCRFRMLQAKQTVIGCSPAGEQKQGHVNAELLFKQGQNPRRLAKATGTDRSAQTLARLIREGDEQFVQSVFLQCPQGCDTTDPLKAEIKATHTCSQNTCQIGNLDRIAEVQPEIPQCFAH
jgi:hypothetical protein